MSKSGEISKGSKIGEMLGSWKKILKLSRKPDRKEFMLLLKMNFLGFTLVGSIAYIIHVMAAIVIPSII